MKYFPRFSLSFFVAALLFGSSCKKLPTDTSLLVLNFHSYYGSDSVLMGKSHITASGDSISFSRASFYVSGVQLINTAGTSVAVPGNILVTSTTGLNIVMGSVPVDTYKSISFYIGIAPAFNHVDPGTYTSGPLAAQVPAMHFSTDSIGYIFMAVEGLADSTNNHASPNKAFSYHIGTDALLETVNLPDHSVAPYTAFAATGTKVVTINMIADFSRFLQNVNIPQQLVTNTTDNVVLADTLAAHIPLMFRYQN
jgi:hypothetical protein